MAFPIMLILFIVISLFGGVLKGRYSKWLSNLYFGILWIAIAYIKALCLVISTKNNQISLQEYQSSYTICYFFAIIGCFYLFPVILGNGKRKKPTNKHHD